MVYISAKYYGTYKIGFDGGEPEMVFKSSGGKRVLAGDQFKFALDKVYFKTVPWVSGFCSQNE